MKGILLAGLSAVLVALPAKADKWATGDLRCATVRVEEDRTWNPKSVVANGCREVVFWAMCVNYASKVDNDYYNGVLQPGEETRIMMYPQVDEAFQVEVNFLTNSDLVEYPAC